MKNLIQTLDKEYKPNYSIFREENDDMHLLKQALQKLDDGDKAILYLYIEYQSLRKVGKKLGVSHTIVYKTLKLIKGKIYDIFKNDCNNNDSVLLHRLSKFCNADKKNNLEYSDEE